MTAGRTLVFCHPGAGHETVNGFQFNSRGKTILARPNFDGLHVLNLNIPHSLLRVRHCFRERLRIEFCDTPQLAAGASSSPVLSGYLVVWSIWLV